MRPDGSIIWANLTFCLARLEGGEPGYFIAVIEDISDRKKGEMALQQASRAKDTFISHMSHELRTPLNSVIGFSNILKNESDLTVKQLKSVDIINQSGQHLLTLINDVLSLSKLNANKLELIHNDLNLVRFLHDTAAVFRVRAQEKDLDFVTQISGDLPKAVSVDETRLRQVLFNLLSNAIKFTEAGSVILSVSCAAKISHTQNIRFQVEDTGRGISEAEYDLVFSPFGQIDQSNYDSEGTGLGIPICQNILKLMNSQLHLGSKIGRGSLFWFDLELEEVSASLLSTSAKSASQSFIVLNEPCKVLVVDDNKDNRILLVEYLQPLGFALQEANNGAAGMEIAQDFNPDVILVDLLMPVMDGKTMIKEIRQNPLLKDTLILMISANIQSIIDSSQIECEGFLDKPVDFDKLLELLNQHLKLDWQYPSESESELDIANALVYPELNQLNQLLELASCGDMEGLLNQIDLLETTDSQYISFAQQVRQLADNCQQDKLERLFRKSIEQ